jgi:hypothetical protein
MGAALMVRNVLSLAKKNEIESDKKNEWNSRLCSLRTMTDGNTGLDPK